MALSSGTRLGPYEIIGLLGAGGQGEVYRARDPRLGREVAIKVLPPGSSGDADRARRFEQEARAAGALNHPNVLAVFDVGSQEGSSYIVSELLEGETLREHLSGAALPLRKAIDIAIQVSKGLGAAHARGIVHRDLKPENLLLTRDGRVKILDFGLAKLALPPAQDSEFSRDPTRSRVTGPGVVMGTVSYMSPEQVQGRAADYRSDLFSLGTILFEMLSGRRAFEKDSAVETMTAVLREDPFERAPLPSGVPPGLERIIRHSLEKNPEERFQSAHDLAFALEALPFASGPALASSLLPTVRRRRWLRATAAAVALLTLLAITFVSGRKTAERPIPSFQRLTFRRGMVSSARFAPDGGTIVYGASWEGAPTRLFSRRIEGRESNRVDLPDADIAAVSSTGEMAVMLGHRLLFNSGPPGTLARVPLSGGAPREVLKDVHGADWSPDGQSLCVIRLVLFQLN
jgi:serine/threonine protein kinase